MSRLDRGEKALKTFVWEPCGGFDGPMLLVSDDASSSAVEWRSNLLMWGRDDGEGEAGSISNGDACTIEGLIFVSIVNDDIPLWAP